MDTVSLVMAGLVLKIRWDLTRLRVWITMWIKRFDVSFLP